MKCTMKNVGLAKAFDIDGKIVFPSAYMSYAPDKKNFDVFKQYGINVFMFGIYTGDEGINMCSGLRPFCDNFYKGYGEYDFSYVEKIMTDLNPTGEEDIYVIPRVCLETPKWWQKLNPDELGCDHTGAPLRYCFNSQKWREDMTAALKALIDYFENSKWKDKVIGYHIACGGTEEWTYQARYDDAFYDYSERNLEAYRLWLQKKYATCEKLSEAWGRTVTAWEEVQFPAPIQRVYAKKGFLRTPKDEMDVLDYYDFHNESVADTIHYYCKQVKDYTNNTRITGVFYGYTIVIPQNYKGLHALHKVLESPYVDFVSTTNWWKDPGGAWTFAATVQSALLNGKMWIAEGDLRTSLSNNLGDTLPEALPDNDYYTSWVWQPLAHMDLSESVITKGMARTITANTGIWWFDMFGGWFNDDKMMSKIKQMSSLLAKQQHTYLKPDVALVVDETAYKYFGIPAMKMRDGVDANIEQLSYAGFVFDNYLISDIAKDNFPADQYKLILFVNCVNPKEEEKAAINAKLKKDGKTLLWTHASSCFDSSLNNFKLKEAATDMTECVDYNGKQFCDVGKPGEAGAFSLPAFRFDNEEGFVVARFAESREPAVMWKRMGDYNAVHSLTMGMSTELYRQLAILAGVHVYNRTGDCIYAGGEFAGIHAVEEGYRRISLPHRGYKATNALTGEPISVNECFIDMYLKQYETVLIHLEREEG